MLDVSRTEIMIRVLLSPMGIIYEDSRVLHEVGGSVATLP